ncbi:osmolarity sensor protein [Thauera linaloolentis 47Lol = DSM 12138]|uniref:histidine kinase n=1 Tax=Thauera linaloolentis (strain DSM 12138 / JCM 21573 / CCUG 41526 / CIP 105981 / IAM 15112 / NBRC 102519 / 47Lol) TaxID=1123367 RepID=N6YUT5_THAL4|nr:osmolarity sensor protein [Thauera linaloolentis 47Lol = DSM 12138]
MQACLPRTLLWKTFLLVALLLILALGSWSQIFRYFQEPARSRDVAQMVVSVVNLTRTALTNADAERRTDLLIELAALEGIRIYPAEASDELEPLRDTRPNRLLAADVRRQLGDHTRLASRWKSLEGFWVSFRLDPEDQHDEYWVMLPGERIENPDSLDWLIWGLGALVAAMLGAYLIASWMGKPLRQVARAARLVGSGQTPPPLDESGPQEIAVVAHAFNQMTGDLARTDADRALILAGVSHDLRTPLARLRLGVEMSGAPEGEVTAMVSDIEEMDRIIGQFLDFGRGVPQEPAQPEDVAQLVREITEPYRLRGIDLHLDAPQTLVNAVRALSLRRAVANLIDNALRYAGEDKRLDVSVGVVDGEVCIEVADRGPGIPENEVERMRHPFTRLEKARTNTKGAGLGLAIVERVMRSHGGRLDLLPREGGGLRAILCLPAGGNASARARMQTARQDGHEK